MDEQGQDARIDHAILKGRLVLSFVSARAQSCPRPLCGRLKRCTARFGQEGSNLHTRIGDCPNMSEAEWRAVSLGIQMNWHLLQPWFKARERARAEEEKEELSGTERQRRRHAPAPAQPATEERTASAGAELGVFLWREVRDDRLVMARDLQAAEALLLRFMRGRFCGCAHTRSPDGCAELSDRCERGRMAIGE